MKWKCALEISRTHLSTTFDEVDKRFRMSHRLRVTIFASTAHNNTHSRPNGKWTKSNLTRSFEVQNDEARSVRTKRIELQQWCHGIRPTTKSWHWNDKISFASVVFISQSVDNVHKCLNPLCWQVTAPVSVVLEIRSDNCRICLEEILFDVLARDARSN